MRYPKVVQLVALLLCVGLIYGSSRLVPGINEGRRLLNMYGSADVLENTPADYVFAIQALGAFRSLILNFAFIRAEMYKEQGRYFDARQLAEWICTLQPHFPSVWEFQSWNLAWNISVTTYTPEERWNWVYNGATLLRDRGIPQNRRAVNLYKQLAWIFVNKMSENTDDFHWDYKRNWAWRMHLLLGPRPTPADEFAPDEEIAPVIFDVTDDPLLEMARTTGRHHDEQRRRRQVEENVPFRTSKSAEQRFEELPLETVAPTRLTPAEAAKRAAYHFIKAIADAPRSLPELYEQVPETREMVAQLREIGVIITDDTLSEDDYWYDGKLAATFFARYRKLVDTPSLRADMAGNAEGAVSAEQEVLEHFDEIIGARQRRPAGRALLRFLQRKVLSEAYKLDPERMAYLVEYYGPMDWRMVDAHSLYWVAEGLIQGGETISSFQNDKTNTARLIFFSLRNLFHRNQVAFEPHPENIYKSYYSPAPDPSFIEPMHRAYITLGPMLDPDPGDAGGAGSIFRTGHINFLTEAVRMLWFSDRLPEAEHYYEYLRLHYSVRPDGGTEDRYAQPLRDFVIRTFYGSIEGPRETERVINDLLTRAYNELSEENVTSYNRYVAKTLELHQAYMSEKSGQAGPRMKLRPFQEYQIDAFGRWLLAPPIRVDIQVDAAYLTIRKTHLWRRAPEHLRQWVYDGLLEMFRYECEINDFDVTKAFPEPVGMDAFRKAHPRRAVERPDPTIDTPVQPSGD